MEYAARKSSATSKLLTLCPGYKLFSPNFKSAYFSLLNIVLAGIVPGMQIIPLIMNHSLFTLSKSLISGLLAPFLGHFSRCNGISHAQDFRFFLQTWSPVALLIPQFRELRFTKFVLFQSALWYSGRSILSWLSLCSVCAIWEQPHNMWVLFLNHHHYYDNYWRSSTQTGVPQLRKFGSLSIQEILVVKWPYACPPARPPELRPSTPQGNQCKITQSTGMQPKYNSIFFGGKSHGQQRLVKYKQLKIQ